VRRTAGHGTALAAGSPAPRGVVRPGLFSVLSRRRVLRNPPRRPAGGSARRAVRPDAPGPCPAGAGRGGRARAAAAGVLARFLREPRPGGPGRQPTGSGPL